MTELSGVFAKIERAKRHAAELAGRLEEVISDDLQRFWFDHDPQTKQYILRVEGVPSIDSEWSLIVGDCLANLRSALDHLAWQLVLLDKKSPGDKTQFPIRETPFNQKGVPIPTQLQPAVNRQDIIDALEAIQPYMTLDIPPQPTADPRDSPLWMLKTLNNIDKHRLLLVVLAAPSLNMWWGWTEAERGPSPTIKINWSALKNGSPIAWFDFHGAEPPDDFDPHAGIQVVLNETDALRINTVPVPNALETFIWWVEWNVVRNYFAPLF